MGGFTRWHKSSYSASMGDCAEAGTCRHGVAVRDSKDPGGPVLVFGAATWRRFTGALKRDAAAAASLSA